MKQLVTTIAVALALAPALSNAEPVKIGFISTLSGPSALLGQDILDGFNLAVEHSGGSLGGREVDLITGDDQLKPDVARQLADRMVLRDKVDIVTGIIWSNVMLAIAKPVLDSGTFVISPNAGPSQYAGVQCHPQYFAVGFQNDVPNEAMGMYMQDEGYDNVYLMAPNYPAGRDMLNGFKRYYKGKVSDEVYTQLGQLDYAAELAQLRAKKPNALYYFISGGPGINFVKQYAQAGLKDSVPLFAPGFSIDQTILPAVGDAGVGAMAASFWSADLDNDVNKKFVADFEAKFKRSPSPYAAQGYDTGMLINSALAKTNGDTSDKKAFQAALEQADFDSVRGNFKFNTNHYPIQDYYLVEVVKDADGKATWKTIKTIVQGHADSYAADCKMASK